MKPVQSHELTILILTTYIVTDDIIINETIIIIPMIIVIIKTMGIMMLTDMITDTTKQITTVINLHVHQMIVA